MESTALARTARRRGVARAAARPSHTEGSERRSVVICAACCCCYCCSRSRCSDWWRSWCASATRPRAAMPFGTRLGEADRVTGRAVEAHVLPMTSWRAYSGRPREAAFFHRRHVCERLNVPSQSAPRSTSHTYTFSSARRPVYCTLRKPTAADAPSTGLHSRGL